MIYKELVIFSLILSKNIPRPLGSPIIQILTFEIAVDIASRAFITVKMNGHIENIVGYSILYNFTLLDTAEIVVWYYISNVLKPSLLLMQQVKEWTLFAK